MSAAPVPLKPGARCAITIEKLVPGGEGLGRVQGFPIFVPGGLPGDYGTVRIISLKKDYGRGLFEKLEIPSPERIAPPCALVGSCGGCQWQHQRYEAQLRMKRALLLETLQRVAHVDRAALEAVTAPVKGMANPWHYRNKGQFPIQNQGGKIRIGFYAPRSHTLVPIETCLLHPVAINEALQLTEKLLNQFDIPAYEERTQSGFIRHLIIRQSFSREELLIGLVTREWEHPALPSLVEALRQGLPRMVGLIQNRNPIPGNRILGPENRLLVGQDTLEENLGPWRFRISLPSFFQVNPLQTVVLYDTIQTLAQLSGQECILDAFAGTGTIGLWLSAQAKQVFCLETVAEAIADGQRNAAFNQTHNLTFIQGRVEEVLPRLLKQVSLDRVILDPPRKGCDSTVLKALLQAHIPRLIYVSCNPATLARDLAQLHPHYQIERIQPVDMFPHTHHLETVVALVRAANAQLARAEPT